MPEPISLNARIGALALALFAPLHFLVSLSGAALAPLVVASWLGVSFGMLCLCEELGPSRPLNRAGLILFAAAFFARLLTSVASDPALQVRAELLFAFATMGALLFWSVALMHRPQAPRVVGVLGAAVAGSTLALIVAAHVLVGGATILGFSRLFVALSQPTIDTSGAISTVNAIVCLWALLTAGLLFKHRLRAALGPSRSVE